MDESQLRKKSWDNAVHTCGKAYIFSNRARFYSGWIRRVTLLGVIVPVAVGAILLGYGIDDPDFIKMVIRIAIPLSIIHRLIASNFDTFQYI